MNEFRVKGIGPAGTPIQAILTAKNKSEARLILERKGIRIEKLEQKREFNYYITTENKKKLTGKKQAFNAQELKDVFIKHGYKKVRVEMVLIDIKMKPPMQSILQFINLSSFMLNEDMTYEKILELLAESETNQTLKNTLKSVQNELKKGREGEEVFKQYEWVFGKFPAYMLGLATKSGNMAEVYQATAKYMERDFEYRKSLRQAFMMPLFTVVLMLGGVVFYLGWIFPATADMFIRFGYDVPTMTKATLVMSNYFVDNMWYMILGTLIPLLLFSLWFTTPKGAFYKDKWIVKIPILGELLHKTSIEIFFRVFGSIYSGAENNIETLRAASEACRNKWMENGVKEIAIPLMLRDGASLVPALGSSKVFNRTTLNRLKTGAETGNILASANQLARYYEQETTYKMKGVIMAIENIIWIIVAFVLILLTFVSSEIAFFQPKTPGMPI